MKDLTDKSVMVTGAASGIGRAAALAFARERARPMILNDIDAAGLEETAGMVRALGCDCFVLPADVSDIDAVLAMVRKALDAAGRIDVLANIAGIGVMAPIECQEYGDWKRVIDVDLWGVVNTSFAVLPHMMERGSGHIVNIASISGLWCDMLYIAPYVTAKFGVVGLSHALLCEGSLHGVESTCVCPGVVRTPIYQTNPVKGFKEEKFREAYRYLKLIGQEPEVTARAIVRAVKKNRFMTVTSPFYRADYFVRRHLAFLIPALDRLWPRVIDRLVRSYKE